MRSIETVATSVGKDGRLEQIGDDAQADQAGVCQDVPRRSGRVAWYVHLGGHKRDGEAARDADDEIEQPGDSREGAWVTKCLLLPRKRRYFAVALCGF